MKRDSSETKPVCCHQINDMEIEVHTIHLLILSANKSVNMLHFEISMEICLNTDNSYAFTCKIVHTKLKTSRKDVELAFEA